MKNKLGITLSIISAICLVSCIGLTTYNYLTEHGIVGSASRTSLLTGKSNPENSNGNVGDSYVNLTTYDYYLKESTGWVKKGNIKGTSGVNGTDGSNGSNGTDGSTVLTGNSAPSEEKGSVGDSYIDLSSYDYYLKESTGWVKKGNIKGSQGEKGDKGSSGSNGVNGTDGSTILSGSSVPSDGDGKLGDFYIKTDDGKIYKKTSSGWELQLMLTTDSSTKGDAGKDGSQIYIGGTQPSSSNDGDIWVKDDGSLYKNVSGTWTSQGISLKGAQGDAGSRGVGIYTGASLPSDNSSYINGDLFILSGNGKVYKFNGTSWQDQSFTLKGDTGIAGSKILTNSGVPTSSLGSDGDLCINTLTGDIYQKASGTWSATSINLEGSHIYTGNGTNYPTSSIFKGDKYIDLDTGKLYEYDGSKWNDSNFTLKGERGNKVFTGTSNPSDATTYIDGDLYINSTSGDLFSYDADGSTKWNKLINVKGTDGTDLLTGNGAPASSLGKEGDSYIDLSKFELYTKTSSGWGSGVCFKGEDGKDGATIITGSGVPSVDDNKYKVNDLYLDTATGKIYKYELDSGTSSNKWNELLTIKGEKGDTYYSCTILPSKNGYITLDKGSFKKGENVTFTVVPDTGYYCSSFKLNGTEYVNSLNSNSYTTTMVENGFVVSATFKSYADTAIYFYADGTVMPDDDETTSYYDGDWDAIVDKYYSVDTTNSTVTMWSGWTKTKNKNGDDAYIAKTSTISLAKNGVYPSSVVDGKTIDNSLGIVNNAIKWRYVSEDNDGNTQFVSEYLIGNALYHGSSNNYGNSSIRTLLNDTYLSKMWSNTSDQPEIVTVDNSAATTNNTSNGYACSDTNDKLYLLSYKDYLNPEYGFTNSTSSTDKRKAKLLVDNTVSTSYKSGSYCWYWTRSPDSNYSGNAWSVRSGGFVSDDGVDYSGSGVRPACKMNLKN